jgi:hypothetical protein
LVYRLSGSTSVITLKREILKGLRQAKSKKRVIKIEKNLSKMKILFLDIDGVLNSKGIDLDSEDIVDGATNYTDRQKSEILDIKWDRFSNQVYKKPLIKCDLDYGKIKLLAYIIKVCNLKVVVTSTWRHYYTNEELDYLFKQVCETWVPSTIISSTQMGQYDDRHIHVKNWLDANPEITEFVILDDRNIFKDELESRFIQTHRFFGLTIIEACLICKKFGIRLLDECGGQTTQIPDFEFFSISQYLENIYNATGLEFLDTGYKPKDPWEFFWNNYKKILIKDPLFRFPNGNSCG